MVLVWLLAALLIIILVFSIQLSMTTGKMAEDLKKKLVVLTWVSKPGKRHIRQVRQCFIRVHVPGCLLATLSITMWLEYNKVGAMFFVADIFNNYELQ
jgi:hypothetical protein